MFYTIIRGIVGVILHIFFRIRVIGEFNPVEGERYVIASNHRNLLDPLVLGVIFKQKISFMAKQELFENKILAKIIYGLNAFPVNRTGNDIAALKKAVKLLKEGKNVGIFIEGTRVNSYDPQNAKAGPILIANMGKAKIIPVFIESNYKLFSKINIYIRDPYDVVINKASGDDSYQEQARKVLNIIYNG
ncbi:MAG: 1-acyl-sn-glycerol-3-phosphate acyltransferase [Tissierellia bacterium]|nr:1-acyl-sn-glycerol-3-phosphate acyltransferase [Tissierellia bacterium]